MTNTPRHWIEDVKGLSEATHALYKDAARFDAGYWQLVYPAAREVENGSIFTLLQNFKLRVSIEHKAGKKFFVWPGPSPLFDNLAAAVAYAEMTGEQNG